MPAKAGIQWAHEGILRLYDGQSAEWDVVHRSSALIKRVWQHKTGISQGFTSKYHVNRLVYYEVHGDIREAIKREKNIQAWKRNWKLRLIEKQNPDWNDLYDAIIGKSGCQPSLA